MIALHYQGKSTHYSSALEPLSSIALSQSDGHAAAETGLTSDRAALYPDSELLSTVCEPHTHTHMQHTHIHNTPTHAHPYRLFWRRALCHRCPVQRREEERGGEALVSNTMTMPMSCEERVLSCVHEHITFSDQNNGSHHQGRTDEEKGQGHEILSVPR